MERTREQETAPEPKPTFLQTAFFGLLRAASYFQEKKMFADSRREAKDYEKRAAKLTDGEAEHGRLLLSAGQGYLNARMTDKAVTTLEAAQPGMECYKKEGTHFGFLGLARFYQTLGAAYRLSGRTEDHEATQGKAQQLAVEMEASFGTVTRFAPNGDRMTNPAPAPAAETI